MKISKLALLIISIAITSACEDKMTTQKLLEAEKHILQLENQLKSAQQALNHTQSAFPSLYVEIVPLFNQAENVPLTQEQQQDLALESTNVKVFVSIPKTTLEWLNQLLLLEIAKIGSSIAPSTEQPLSNSVATQNSVTQEQLFHEIQTLYHSLIEYAKSEPSIGLHSSIESQYLGQRHQIASFSVMQHEYSGDAHGMYMTRYLHIDTDKQKVIDFNSLIPPENHEQVRKALWEVYRSERLNEQSEYNGIVAAEADFRLSDNVYFTPNSIEFVYQPYELGSFSEGEVEVGLAWETVNKWLSPDYQRTAKDGFEPNTL